MSDMHHIGTLFTHFQTEVNRNSAESNVQVKDMISGDKFAAFDIAVQNASSTDDSQIKSGLNPSFYFFFLDVL